MRQDVRRIFDNNVRSIHSSITSDYPYAEFSASNIWDLAADTAGSYLFLNVGNMRARIDGINPEHGVIFDLKTSKDAHPTGFQREAGQFQYHLQMAFYKRLAELEFDKPFEVFIIAQETEAPFNSGLYRISDN